MSRHQPRVTAREMPSRADDRSPLAHPLLLYDGRCGLCARSVQFMLRRERQCTLRFAPLQGEAAARLLRERPALARVDSVLWVEPGAGGRVLVRSEAALAALGYLGGVWRPLAALARLVPRVLRDALYDAVARRRYGIWGRDTRCLLPTPEQRARFLD